MLPVTFERVMSRIAEAVEREDGEFHLHGDELDTPDIDDRLRAPTRPSRSCRMSCCSARKSSSV